MFSSGISSGGLKSMGVGDLTLEFVFFFFQAEDGIRDDLVTGVQTCALPIYNSPLPDRNTDAGCNTAPFPCHGAAPAAGSPGGCPAGCAPAAHCPSGPALRLRPPSRSGPSGPWACPGGRSGSGGWRCGRVVLFPVPEPLSACRSSISGYVLEIIIRVA